MEQLYQDIIKELYALSWQEVIAVIFGILSVLFSKQNNIWVYPTGIISSALFMYIFFNGKLYAEASLNIYYLIMSAYGWYAWARKDAQEHHISISRITRKELSVSVAISLLGWGLIYMVLKNFTDSPVPAVDAFVSATAWAGMWLLAKRKVENWIFLNISNFVAVPLLFYKHFALTALLTIFLFIIAVLGYYQWLRIYKKETNTRY